MQRSASPFGWDSGLTDEFEVGRTDVIDAGKRRSYAFIWQRGVQGSQGSQGTMLEAIMRKMNDEEISTTPRDVIEPTCSIHRAQLLGRSNTDGFKPDVHKIWRVNRVEDESSKEPSIGDFWSWVEPDDQEFNFIHQQQRLTQELPGDGPQAQRQGFVIQSGYEYIQHEAQMYSSV